MMERISEAFLLISRLAEKLGVSSIKDLPGTWDHAIDADWSFRLNGHETVFDGIPAFTAAISWRGTPYGMLDPYGGIMIGHDGGAEDSLIEALKKVLEDA